MESVQQTSYQLPPMNEVPLASLVFLNLLVVNAVLIFCLDNVYFFILNFAFLSVLSRLGFTNEQPINWDNIILPEKTDLYQELARRITNYK